MTAARVGELLRDLASDDGEIAEEAQAALEGRLDAVGPLLRAVPGLGVFGTLCAIEVIQSWPIDAARGAKDPSVGDVVLPLLRHDNATVREWAADVLGWIGEARAAPDIEDALGRSKAAGVPVDWSEPVAYRRALVDLGAREQVLPMRAGQLARHELHVGLHWAARDLVEVVEALASEQQVLLYAQAWRPHQATFAWNGSLDYEVDLVGDWQDIVARGRSAAVRAAREWSQPDGTFVTLEWIAEPDR